MKKSFLIIALGCLILAIGQGSVASGDDFAPVDFDSPSPPPKASTQTLAAVDIQNQAQSPNQFFNSVRSQAIDWIKGNVLTEARKNLFSWLAQGKSFNALDPESQQDVQLTSDAVGLIGPPSPSDTQAYMDDHVSTPLQQFGDPDTSTSDGSDN